MKFSWLAAALVGFSAASVLASWQIQSIETTSDFRGLCVVSPTVAWTSGTKGTFGRTIDAGKTWGVGTVPDAEKLDFRDVEAFGTTTAYLLAAGPGEASRIYKTVDGGRSWMKQFQNADPATFFNAMAFWDADNGLAFGDPVQGRFALIATNDGGAHWKPLAPKTLPAALAGESAFAASGTSLVTLGDRDVWFATGGATTARVFHSRDRGQTWEVSDTPLVAGSASSGVFSIAFRDAQHGMIVGGDYRDPETVGANAALTADAGRTWTLLGKRLPYCSAVVWAKDRWIAVGPSGSFSSADDGKTWNPLDREASNSVACTAQGDGWVVGPKGRIAKLAK